VPCYHVQNTNIKIMMVKVKIFLKVSTYERGQSKEPLSIKFPILQEV